MSVIRVPFPTGVRSLVGDAVRRRRRLENVVVPLLEDSGYEEILLPIVDFADPYSGLLGEAEQRRAYRFTGRDGELITVRADFTPMVARAIAPLLTRGSTRRLFYRGDVVRCEASRLGRGREFFQIGAELIGDSSVRADAEMMRLAAAVIAAAGGDPVVTMNHTAILPSLLGYSALPQREWPEITAAVRSKRGEAVRLVTAGMREPEARLLTSMVEGELELADLRNSAATREIGLRLEDVLHECAAAGVRAVPVLDDIEETSYYSGIRFGVHARGIDAPIGRGGRYDALYGRFGVDAPAVGFTLTPEPLLPLIAAEDL